MMGFLGTVTFDPGPTISAGSAYLRYPTAADYPMWRDVREKSRSFLAPWEPTWGPGELDKTAYRQRLRRYAQEIRNDTGYPFFIFRKADHQLVGGLTLAPVRRRVSQTATLGYWMGEAYAGKGLMTEAASAVIKYSFDTLQLHRIEAACLPHNAASARLLEKIGFTREGYARSYLCIADRWQDHLLFAIIAGDPVGPRPAAPAG
jgi:ribosomal-protein-alanine N-acetyltransferase